MKRRYALSFRGFHALIEHPPGRDRTVLKTQLELLGLEVALHDSPTLPSYEGIDVLFFDADGPHPADWESCHKEVDLPAVAVIGSETPSRLLAMLARRPSAYLLKPIRSTGIYASLAIATHQFAMLQDMRRKLTAATERLRARPLLFSATLQIMKQAHVDEIEAFRILRRTAMSQRQTIEMTSAQVLAGQCTLSRLRAG